MFGSDILAQLPPAAFKLDSTKLKTYRTCPRRYLLEHIFGFQPEKKSHHLLYGQWFHSAMETLYASRFQDNSREAVMAAFEVFMSEWRRYYGELSPEDETLKPKTPENTFRALAMYAQRYSREDAEYRVIHMESFSQIEVTRTPEKPRYLFAKVDLIVETPYGYAVIDHKTTSSTMNYRWQEQWTMDTQMNTYLHALHCYLGDQGRILGTVVNGIRLTNAPKLKKDGTPYASASDIEFQRVIVARSQDQLTDWLVQVNRWMDLIEDDQTSFEHAHTNDDVLSDFPKNDQACCHDFGGICPFLRICQSRANPMYIWNSPPEGMRIKHWDPTEKEEVK